MDDFGVRHLPVVDDLGRLVGVISDRDLLEATGWLPSDNRRAEGGLRKRPATVDQIMNAKVVTASPDDSVITAAIDLVGRGIGCLPVLSDGVLVGIVSELDLVGAYLQRVDSLPPSDEADPGIEHVMSWHPTTIAADTTLAEARRLMRVNDVRHLPVTEGGNLVGMLSDRDLRRAHGAGRSKDALVEDVMTSKLVTLTTRSRARDVAAAILQNKISAVLVLEDSGVESRLVGIVTVTDLLDQALGTLRDAPPQPEGERLGG
jgi:CBS domain-containing protein